MKTSEAQFFQDDAQKPPDRVLCAEKYFVGFPLEDFGVQLFAFGRKAVQNLVRL